jgi:hypothetical protein
MNVGMDCNVSRPFVIKKPADYGAWKQKHLKAWKPIASA